MVSLTLYRCGCTLDSINSFHPVPWHWGRGGWLGLVLTAARALYEQYMFARVDRVVQARKWQQNCAQVVAAKRGEVVAAAAFLASTNSCARLRRLGRRVLASLVTSPHVSPTVGGQSPTGASARLGPTGWDVGKCGV